MKQEIDSLISQIKDKTVKTQYSKALNDLLWNFTKTKKARTTSTNRIVDNKRGAQIAKNSLINKNKIEETLLLALTLQHPEHTLIFEEQLAEISFSDHEHRIIKKALFDFLEKGSLDKQVLNNYLKSMNLLESKNRVF